MNVLSAGLVVIAVPTSLAVAFGGMFDVAAAAFGLLWLIEFARRATGHWKLRRRFRFSRPRSRALTGWRITAAALGSAACCAGCVIAAFRGSAAGSAVLGVLAAVLGVRCAVARLVEQAQAEQARIAEQAAAERAEAEAAWTNEDDVILGGDLTLTAWKRAGQAARGEQR